MPERPSSYKVEVIDAIFSARWDSASQSIADSLVTLSDVSEGIRKYNAAHPEQSKPISDRNPANFFKDIIRKRANHMWPARILALGYTGKQVTGRNACFRFVPLRDGQTEPFPSHVPDPTDATPRIKISSVSMPLASRRLGRSDESWLIQVAIRLHIIDTHLGLFSQRKIIQVDHLQTAVKLGQNEIDAILLATEEAGAGQSPRESIVCCEAKSMNEQVIEEQIIGHVASVFQSLPGTWNTAIPICVKTIARSAIRVLEFEAVERENAAELVQLTLVSDAIYELVPPVPGI